MPLHLSPDQKFAGVLAPLFALRGHNDLGIGDLGALREFIDWPEGQRSFAQAQAWLAVQKAAKRQDLEQRIRLVSYVQWIAWEQWRGMHDYATSNDVALMGDIPFGVSYYSADVWTRPELFDHI